MKKKMLEDKIWDYIDKHIYGVYFLLITVFAIVIRMILMKYESGDYTMFLKPWFDELQINEGILGLSKDIGNYTPIYMTILAIFTYIPVKSLISIKIFSIIFDFIGGIYIMKIVKELLKNNKNKDMISLIMYAIYLFLPTVILNSSYWAQSDSIYTCFVIISLYYLIKNNFIKGIIFWSIAFSFKFQAIFIFPLYVLMYFSDRKLKFKYFLLIPFIIFIFSIPKVVATRDLLVGFKLYFNQAGTYKQYITLNLPNFYGIFLQGESNLIYTRFDDMGMIGIIITMVILITMAFLVRKNKIKFDSKTIIDFGLWSILITTFFLPQMHERYLFMGDVIGILYFIINKNKYYVPIIIELISLNGYMYLLFSGFAVNFSLLSVVFLILIIMYSVDMFKKYFKLI